MLHTIDRNNKHLYAREMEQSYKLRHEVFVVEKKWMALNKPDKREIDQFDTDDAVYLLSLDDQEQNVVGGVRLLPTTKPYILSSVLADMVSRPPPSDDQTFEFTRMFVARSHREGHAISNTSCEIFCGTLEHCLENGITKLVLVGEVFWLPRLLEMGWNPRPLGLPKKLDGVSTIAFSVSVSEAALSTTRAIRGIGSSVLAKTREAAIIDRPVVRPIPFAR